MIEIKYLIVNADDLGLSQGVNAGIIKAHERGIVTSASLMVRGSAASDAETYCRKYPDLSIGLHLDFGEWIWKRGEWLPLYEVVSLTDEKAVRNEVFRQLADFRGITGTDPTHIDSHQHVHRSEPLQYITKEVAQSIGIPLRHFSPEISYRGDFYGQTEKGESFPGNISFGHLLDILLSLPPGITELACHPGNRDRLNTMYVAERSQELQVLCDPRLKKALEGIGIRLCSFRTIHR
jgi:predicted glycoside hydrolase/deacetylase ChbG (UPF0249 family)